MTFASQDAFDVRFEWGERGVVTHARTSDALVIVDVLSFGTAVDVAVARGAEVLPYRWGDESAASFAKERGAILAKRRGEGGYSLSPPSLAAVPKGTRLVLPSPNGSTLATLASEAPTFAACFRNASAVARAAARLGPRVAVIASGERWHDGSLRPAVEDLLAAGAVIAKLPGTRSPEADAALAAFERAKPRLAETLRACASGRELIDAKFPQDVEVAAQLDVSEVAPRYVDGAYRAAA